MFYDFENHWISILCAVLTIGICSGCQASTSQKTVSPVRETILQKTVPAVTSTAQTTRKPETTTAPEETASSELDIFLAMARSIRSTREWGDGYLFSLITTADGLFLCANENQGLGDTFWIYDAYEENDVTPSVYGEGAGDDLYYFHDGTVEKFPL